MQKFLFINTKKNAFWLLLLFVITSLQCKKDTIGNDVNYNIDYEIPAGIAAFPQTWVIETPTVSDNKYWLDKFGIDRAKVKSVEVKYIHLAILNSNDNFAFVERAFARIFSTAKPSAIEIGFNENVSNTQGNTLDLVPNLTEVQDYFLGDRFTLQTRLQARYSTTAPLQVRLSVGFRVVSDK